MIISSDNVKHKVDIIYDKFRDRLKPTEMAYRNRGPAAPSGRYSRLASPKDDSITRLPVKKTLISPGPILW